MRLHQHSTIKVRFLNFVSPGVRLGLACCFLVSIAASNLRGDDDALEASGDIVQILLPATGAGIAIYKQDWEGLQDFAESFSTGFLATHGLKNYVGRVRPNFSNTQSYPSGHTMGAFGGASFIQRRYGESMGLWQYLPYAAAGWVAYTRVEAAKHHVGDVVGGAILGTVPTYVFTTPYGGQAALKPVTGSGGSGVQLMAALPGEPKPTPRPDASRGRVYGFSIEDQPMFGDPNDVSLPTRAHTYVSLTSEVTTLPDEQGGWVDVRPEAHWSFARQHELALEIPYRESDLDALGDFERGLGDIRAYYKFVLYQAEDAFQTVQGAAVRVGGFFPTGDPDRALGSDVYMVAPSLSTAFSGMDGSLGVFPTLAYLHSFGDTTARAVPTEDLYRTSLPMFGPEESIRSLFVAAPIQYRFAQRWFLGIVPSLNYEFSSSETSMMLGGFVGLKISEQSAFRFEYAERIAGAEILSARLRLVVSYAF